MQKPKVVTRSNTYAARLREGKKNLILGDSHIIRVKKDKLKNEFDNAKSFVRYFSGTIMQNLHHYATPSLFKEKADIVVSHVGSNDITHRV